MAAARVPIVRLTPDNESVRAKLGLLADLAGDWRGHGFNLIARPNFHDKANLYLQLNQTDEVLRIDPIGSSIPNRGFGQDDIELFGLHYLQKINDHPTGGALHLEPGLWVTQPATAYPPETSPAGTQIIARMGTIPHGNSLLAEGIAEHFEGPPPVLASGGVLYAYSKFPSFNSTPFGIPPAPGQSVINAAGSSEKLTAAAGAVPPFNEYDLSVPDSAANPRTPFDSTEPPLPASIDGVPMQTVINDPITLLQAVIEQQVKDGHSFKGTVLNIATQAPLTFFKNPNSAPGSATTTVSLSDAGGGIENIPFLEGGEPVGPKGANADIVTVYATFWIERVMHQDRPHFMQLQYAQMVILNFPIFTLLPKVVPLGWPHISVATLRKSFG